MKLSIVCPDDPFRGRKCAACKRTAKVGEAVFSRFEADLPSPRCWLVIHLSCLECSEPLQHIIKALDATAHPDYHALRQQILTTKEAFPDAAA